MGDYRLIHIIDFFTNRGWVASRDENQFISLYPKKKQNYPDGYKFSVPSIDNNRDFDRYIDRAINEIRDILNEDISTEDLQSFFKEDISIFKFRIHDEDNTDGSIKFTKQIEILGSIKNAFSKAVTFVATDHPIFANARDEVNMYINSFKSLQTEKGSYVSKLKLPNVQIPTTTNNIHSTEINNKLVDVLEFVKGEIFDAGALPAISINYCENNKEYINYELLNSIREIYSKPKVNNIDFQLCSIYKKRTVKTHHVQPKITKFNQYLREIKDVLLRYIPLDAVGRVNKLASVSPLTSQSNDVILDALVGGDRCKVKVVLNSAQYQQAIEAHRNEWTIRVVGLAKQSQGTFIVTSPDVFQINEQGE